MIKGSIRSAAAWILLLAVAVLATRKAYGLYGAYHEFRAVEKQLPDLPQVIPPIAERRSGFPDKIWVHPVNSVERARLMAKEYRGLEMDVVYDSAADYYDVGHPPTPSLGISLDQVFSSLPDVGSHYFWLDFKNLSDANKEAACARLVSLAGKHRIAGLHSLPSPRGGRRDSSAKHTGPATGPPGARLPTGRDSGQGELPRESPRPHPW